MYESVATRVSGVQSSVFDECEVADVVAVGEGEEDACAAREAAVSFVKPEGDVVAERAIGTFLPCG